MRKRRVKPLAILDGEISIPGSKSYTARALVIGALASGETLLRNPLHSEDTDYMIKGLKTLGVTIEEGRETISIMGTGGKLNPSSEKLFLGNAGTAVRFLTTVAGLARKPLVIDGNERMRERPIQDLLEGLEPLGILARSINGDGYPPIVVADGHFEGGRTVLRGRKSSQFLSSILLCAPYAKKAVLMEVTDDLVSRSYVDLTLEIMRDFGAQVTHQGYRIFRVIPATYVGREYVIEGDLSSASYFFAAAAITGGRVRVKGVNPHSKQGDVGFLDVLESMGCRVYRGDNHVEVAGESLEGIDIDMRAMPDTVQTLAVVAAFARGTTRIFQVEHLQYKETDRITALKRELTKMGIKTASEKDTLIIEGGEPRGTEVDTYGDHRMAMAFAIAGLRTDGMVIRNPNCVNKSLPTFWNLLEGLR